MAIEAPALPAADHVMLPGIAVAGIEDVAFECCHYIPLAHVCYVHPEGLCRGRSHPLSLRDALRRGCGRAPPPAPRAGWPCCPPDPLHVMLAARFMHRCVPVV